jgi:hypothetical protein
MPVSSLPVIARYLGVSIEELIGEPPSAAAKQRFVMQVIDTVLVQQGR